MLSTALAQIPQVGLLVSPILGTQLSIMLSELAEYQFFFTANNNFEQ
jgi:hypothetical protein